MNNPFEFVVAIVAIVMGAGVIRTALYARSKSARQAKRLDLTAKRLEETFDERLNKIEDRLANIETLVLEEEKARKFDAL